MSTEPAYAFDVIHDIESPLAPAKLEAPGGNLVRMIVKGPLTDADAEKLAACAARYKRVSVVYSVREGVPLGLGFLRFFSRVHEVSLHSNWYAKATGLDELEHLPDNLESLTLNANNPRLNLDLVKRLKNLKELNLTGKLANIEVLAGLGRLEKLLLQTTTLPDVSILGGLKSLKEILIYHGGNSDLSILGSLSELENVFLWRIRGLESLDWVAELPHLRTLDVGGLSQVKSLPPLHKQTQLHKVNLDQMKGLTSLASVAVAPSLARLRLVGMNQLTVEDFRCLAGHPALKGLETGLSSKKKREAVAQMTGVGTGEYKIPLPLREF